MAAPAAVRRAGISLAVGPGLPFQARRYTGKLVLLQERRASATGHRDKGIQWPRARQLVATWKPRRERPEVGSGYRQTWAASHESEHEAA
eukprot:scaffold55679_cov38-Tisochrysis_lutea.AAC.4